MSGRLHGAFTAAPRHPSSLSVSSIDRLQAGSPPIAANPELAHSAPKTSSRHRPRPPADIRSVIAAPESSVQVRPCGWQGVGHRHRRRRRLLASGRVPARRNASRNKWNEHAISASPDCAGTCAAAARIRCQPCHHHPSPSSAARSHGVGAAADRPARAAPAGGLHRRGQHGHSHGHAPAGEKVGAGGMQQTDGRSRAWLLSYAAPTASCHARVPTPAVLVGCPPQAGRRLPPGGARPQRGGGAAPGGGGRQGRALARRAGRHAGCARARLADCSSAASSARSQRPPCPRNP